MRYIITALILTFLLLPHTAISDIYYWIDDQGVQNYAARVESIPEAYRSKAQILLLTPAPPAPSEVTPSPPSKTPTTIPFSPGSPVFVNARINGSGPFRLILDTGADRTMISPSVLSRTGLTAANVPPVILKGVTGSGYAGSVWVNSIDVGETKVGPLLIVVYESDLKGADGLLGRDFLAKLNVTIDAKVGIVTLLP